MNNEKAIEILEIYNHDEDKEGKEAFKAAIKALEKQLLKKPIEHSELPDGEFSYLCPTCNRLYWEWSFISHYCSSCGQRLKLN